MLNDLRYAIRMLRKSPGFTAVVVFTLAMGIGANTAVFSVVNSVLLKPLHYLNAEELVSIRQLAPGAAGLANFDGLDLSPSMYFTYTEGNQTFQSLGVWRTSTANVTGLAEPEQVRTVAVSDGVLQALAVPPAMGRWLSRADQSPRGSESVMLSYGYWQRRFAGDRSAIGRNIRVDSRPREIVGVMPQRFQLVSADFDLIVPLAFDRGKLILADFGFHGIARLKPGFTITQANVDVARMIPIWMDSWSNGPGTNPRIYETWRITPALRPLKQEVLGDVGNVLWVLMGTLSIVMLIACANVANLLLVRVEARRQELAIRAAIGAGWVGIVRQLLLESVLLGLTGGALGVGFAYGGVRLLVALGPANLPRLDEVSIDPRTLGFTLVLSLLSGLLFGLIPALKYAGPRICVALRSAGRTSSVSREDRRARNVLVVAQVAMAVVLLVSAGLMIRTFQALRAVEPGFTHAEDLQTVRISIPATLVTEPERVVRMQNDMVDKLTAIPGVTSAAFASAMPMEGLDAASDGIYAEDKPYNASEIPPLRMFKYVSPGFFQAAGTKMIAGRDFTWTDLYGRKPVAIVSENLARELWGSPSAAVGKRIRPEALWQEVIGVVQDVRNNGTAEPAPPLVYWPSINEVYKGEVDVARTVTFAIRTGRTGTEGFLNEVRQAIWSVNSNLPVASVRTMQDVYEQSLARTSFTLVMLGIAGTMALLLGVVGVYGVISYSVSQRTREIGIRLALGAPRQDVTAMFVRHGLVLSGIGAACGLTAAFAVTRIIKSLLFGVSPADPLTYLVVSVALIVAAMVASYLPARRAAQVDPTVSLRYE